jgi:hypothetical protein
MVHLGDTCCNSKFKVVNVFEVEVLRASLSDALRMTMCVCVIWAAG